MPFLGYFRKKQELVLKEATSANAAIEVLSFVTIAAPTLHAT
jgi:hypothetical protein